MMHARSGSGWWHKKTVCISFVIHVPQPMKNILIQLATSMQDVGKKEDALTEAPHNIKMEHGISWCHLGGATTYTQE